MRSSKSRSRSKSNRNRPSGNIVNRVFDSSGPEGKVRGTPQQIIDKYTMLARDAQLSNDRVAAENFQQHAEHYTRLLSEAQREQDARREQHERDNRERQNAREERQDNPREDRQAPRTIDAADAPQPDIVEVPEIKADSGLVETPESKPAERAPRKPSRSKSKPKGKNAGDADTAVEPAEPEAPDAAAE